MSDELTITEPPAGTPIEPTQTIEDSWRVGDLVLESRLILGTARYPSRQVMLDSLAASGTEVATVALRRVSPDGDGTGDNLYTALRGAGYRILPNTAGCFTAEDAVLTARLARESLDTSWIKLEVIADHDALLPDTEQLLIATERLIDDGFQVLPYTNDDPVVSRKLEQLGCPAVMPLAAPIGSGLGVRNPHNLALIKESVAVPVIVDAGVGTASDVAIVLELGLDAVLLNSAVARAGDPVRMARAIHHAAVAGREAFLARRMPRRFYADPTSPAEGLPWQ